MFLISGSAILLKCPVILNRVALHLTEHYSGLANGVTSPGADWLSGVLLPRILKWAVEREAWQGQRETLIPLDRYCSLYQEMKDRYGQTLIKVH